MAELILVMKEVRRLSRALEAGHTVSMSRTPRLILKLIERLQIIAGKMTDVEDDSAFEGSNLSMSQFSLPCYLPGRISNANCDIERGHACSKKI